MNRKLLEHFGIEGKGFFAPPVFRNFCADIQNAVKENEMIAIVGSVGSGKTTLYRHAVIALSELPDTAPIIVRIQNKDKERMTIASILTAVIYDISTEKPRHDLEARSRQTVRLLGQKAVTEKRKVAILIEEAHRMHANTLRAIKELREEDFAGVSPLFSVILIGHEELKFKLQQRKEVFWRSDMVELNTENGWMTYDQRIKYLKTVYGEAVNETARKRIAALWHVPLELDYQVEKLMREAKEIGKTVIDEECTTMSPMEMYQAMRESYNISMSEISEKSGIPKTTVHSALHTHGHTKAGEVMRAMEKISKEKNQDEAAPVRQSEVA